MSSTICKICTSFSWRKHYTYKKISNITHHKTVSLSKSVSEPYLNWQGWLVWITENSCFRALPQLARMAGLDYWKQLCVGGKQKNHWYFCWWTRYNDISLLWFPNTRNQTEASQEMTWVVCWDQILYKPRVGTKLQQQIAL